MCIYTQTYIPKVRIYCTEISPEAEQYCVPDKRTGARRSMINRGRGGIEKETGKRGEKKNMRQWVEVVTG